MAFSYFNLTILGSAWIYFLCSIILSVFSFIIYRFTLPKVSNPTRILLTVIRSLIFLLVLLLLFEPLLTLITPSTKTKSVFVFLDNSNSLSTKDSLKRIDKVNKLINDLKSESSYNAKFFVFGSKVDSLSPNDKKIAFNKSQTNFEKLEQFLKKSENKIKSAVVISDGIITDGIDPLYQIEKLSFPVMTVGIGDTTSLRDINVYNVTHNEFIYTGKETKIETTILNSGYSNRTVQVSLLDENNIIDSKPVILNSSGMNKIQFNYKSNNSGERKLRIESSPLEGDQNKNNNSKTFFVEVLNSRIKIALLAGSPSADVSAISNALESDKNNQLLKIIQVAQGKDWTSKDPFSLDSAKILFLVDFPCKNMSNQLFNLVLSLIEHGKPFFISVSNSTDLNKLKLLEKYLPASYGNDAKESVLVLPELNSQQYASNFSQLGNSSSTWNNLSPINQLLTETSIKPESNQIVQSKLREIVLQNPLITIRSIANQKSFLLNGWNYWRWSLQTSEVNADFFKNFFYEIVKWLNQASDKQQFTIHTNKKVYSAGEPVEFTAELYDNSFNPIDTAHVELNVNQNKNNVNLLLSPDGNGKYSASFTSELKGDFNYEGVTFINKQKQSYRNGRFCINNISIEKLDTKMRIEYLKLLASSTRGIYIPIDDYSQLKKKLSELTNKKEKIIELKNEYELWNSSLIMIIIIFLFATEWFIRKKTGMI